MMTEISPHVLMHKASNEADNALDALLKHMRSKSDFPALSTIISEINKVIDDDSASTHQLAQTILQDFALTNKLLKLVNTVTYGQFGGQINTISKAVVILGFDTIRNAAMTLILLDFLQNKAQAAQLKDDVLTSFFAGIVASQFATEHNIRDAEEAMICSMFRHLGKILVSFYFFEESQQIVDLLAQNITEDDAALQVLGITYNELGIGIAKSWNFPLRLTRGMRKLTGDKIAKQHNELDHLSLTVNLSHELCTIASLSRAEDTPQALHALVKRYENAMSLSEPQLRQAIDKGLAELTARARVIGLDLAKSSFLQRVSSWSGLQEQWQKLQEDNDGQSTSDLSNEGTDSASEAEQLADGRAEYILTEGIQEITDTLVEAFKLTDVMQMVLETMHRGMQFHRTIFMMRDPKSQKMTAKQGFGPDIDKVLAQFQFELGSVPDVFHLAINEGADLLIEDITAANIAEKIPRWYQTLLGAQSFILLPVVVNKKTVGIFYADMVLANTMQVSPKQLALLRTLRNQLVLAIKQKS